MDDTWFEYDNCHPDDLWVYDKLILSRKLGYVCGPRGVLVPRPDYYIVRPITNIDGMGFGAEIMWIDDTRFWEGKGSPADFEDDIPLGFFWCEIFEGRHLSVDYLNGEQILCVEGFRLEDNPLYKWSSWRKSDDIVPLPDILKDLPYEKLNCEFIDGNLIEVHVRHNPNFEKGYDEIYPVWDGEDITPPPGMIYIKDPNFKRQGFFVWSPRQDSNPHHRD